MAPKSKQRPQKVKPQRTGTKKEHAYDRPTLALPRPSGASDTEPDLSEQELDVLTSNNVTFLTTLDQKGISKSKKEIARLHKLDKPARPKVEDDLPSVHEHTDDESPWEGVDGNEGLSTDDEDGDLEGDEDVSALRDDVPSESDIENTYELKSRKRRREWEEEDSAPKAPGRLPIKLANGQVKKLKDVEGRPVPMPLPDSEEEEEDWPEETEIESDAGDQERQEEERRANNVATGARFGRLAPAAVLSLPSRTERVQRAKEQIASICQDIVADPENSLGLLRRLQTFTLAELPSPDVNAPAVPNDPLIRKLALLSLLSIFTDIVPSYRIRGLTEKEQAEKVSQMVARTREWEQGLVIVYKAYLGELEGAAKANNEMSDTAVRCLCTLLTDLTHFNFHTNIMSVVVARISRRSWDSNSELCRESIVRVFREDVTGQASLELVRLLNRMIKERKFRLGRPVDRREEQEKEGKGRDRDRDKGKKKGKKDKTYLSNKQRKALQETREIQKEMAEAEAQVDVEERDKTHTETLKLLFVLYFSILKSSPSAQNRLLPEALAGVSAFAHLINIDFFRDLLETLKKIARDADGEGDTEGGVTEEKEGEVRIGGAESELARKCRTKLLCVVTAFQLLTGQGEALNIDLAEFINQLYALLPVLGFVIPLEVDTVPLSTKATADNHNTKSAPPPSSVPSVTALLFRALHLLFLPSWHTSGTSSSHPPSRVLAFAKRLLALTLLLPPAPAIRTLEFLRQLRARESKLDGLFEEAEEGGDGVWRGEVDDPALANGAAARGWEVAWLAEKGEEKVREKARELVVWRRT